jgi:hypothetical protein
MAQHAAHHIGNTEAGDFMCLLVANCADQSPAGYIDLPGVDGLQATPARTRTGDWDEAGTARLFMALETTFAGVAAQSAISTRPGRSPLLWLPPARALASRTVDRERSPPARRNQRHPHQAIGGAVGDLS